MSADPAVRIPNEPIRSCRRFNLGDALLLIAGIGSIFAFNRALDATKYLADDFRRWLVLIRYVLFDVPPNAWFPSNLSKGQVFRFLIGDIWTTVDLGLYSALYSLTPVILLIRLRRPRTTLGMTIRQAGTVASSAAVVGCWVSWSARYYLIKVPAGVICIGGAVALAWFVLKLAKFREREPGWIDRMGRFAGWVWIYLALSYALRLLWMVCDPNTAHWSFNWSFWWH